MPVILDLRRELGDKGYKIYGDNLVVIGRDFFQNGDKLRKILFFAGAIIPKSSIEQDIYGTTYVGSLLTILAKGERDAIVRQFEVVPGEQSKFNKMMEVGIQLKNIFDEGKISDYVKKVYQSIMHSGYPSSASPPELNLLYSGVSINKEMFVKSYRDIAYRALLGGIMTYIRLTFYFPALVRAGLILENLGKDKFSGSVIHEIYNEYLRNNLFSGGTSFIPAVEFPNLKKILDKKEEYLLNWAKEEVEYLRELKIVVKKEEKKDMQEKEKQENDKKENESVAMIDLLSVTRVHFPNIVILTKADRFEGWPEDSLEKLVGIVRNVGKYTSPLAFLNVDRKIEVLAEIGSNLGLIIRETLCGKDPNYCLKQWEIAPWTITSGGLKSFIENLKVSYYNPSRWVIKRESITSLFYSISNVSSIPIHSWVVFGIVGRKGIGKSAFVYSIPFDYMSSILGEENYNRVIEEIIKPHFGDSLASVLEPAHLRDNLPEESVY